MTRVLLALLAAATLLAAGLGFWSWRQAGQNALLRAAVHQQAARAEASESLRKKADEALVSLRQKNAALARETAVKQHALDAALAASRPWADAPVPEEVQNALR